MWGQAAVRVPMGQGGCQNRCSRLRGTHVWWQRSQHPPAQTPPMSGISCQGTTLITNLSSVLKDETFWKEPFRFQPEHFLDAQGHFVKQAAFMPFSAGAWRCPACFPILRESWRDGAQAPGSQSPAPHPQAAVHASGSPWPAWSSSSSSPASCSASASRCQLGSPAPVTTVSLASC